MLLFLFGNLSLYDMLKFFPSPFDIVSYILQFSLVTLSIFLLLPVLSVVDLVGGKCFG